MATMGKKERIRLSLDVSPETYKTLEKLASIIDGSKSDVLRKAIALLDIAVEAKQQGQKFGIANKDQQLATEIIGI